MGIGKSERFDLRWTGPARPTVFKRVDHRTMHSYFRAIGYSNIATAPETEKLITKIIKDPASARVTEYKESYPMREYRYECAPGIGITVRCELDTDPVSESETPLRVLNYFPYLSGNCISLNSEIFVSKKVDTRAYHGMCDDSRLGVSLIFYMLNAVDYLNNRLKAEGGHFSRPVMVSALSLDGTILLPVADQGRNDDEIRIRTEKRAKLMNDAQKGDPVAIDSLTRENIDIYSEVMERAKTEDIFSIVNTTFFPYGAESDIYSIVGLIDYFRYVTNKDTGERLCVLTVDCNGMLMDVCINAADLLGEPAKGRRFRGIVWIQGLIEFV